MALLLGLQGRNFHDPLALEIPEEHTVIHQRRRDTFKSTSRLGDRAYQSPTAKTMRKEPIVRSGFPDAMQAGRLGKSGLL